MDFNNTLPEWKNTGTEPSDTLKENGFVAGYKPPANVFNWFWNKVIAAITELQTNLSNAQTQLNAKAPTFHANPETTYGIGTSSNYGHVKLSDSTSTTSGASAGVAATPTAVKAAYDKANISKNSNATDGDIISTHLTIGTRATDETYGTYSFTNGENNSANGADSAVIGGYNNVASVDQSVVIGGGHNTASGYLSAVIGGFHNTASSANSAVIGGAHNTALANQVKSGHFSKDGTAGTANGTTGDAFAIGNGTSSATSNCFRVDYAGNVFGLSSFKGTGADYAEYFEWLDGNPDGIDRRGLFVTLDGEKIRIANDTDDYILGIVSALPSICGDTQSEVWQGMYLKDVYGAYLTDDDGNMILNPEYDDKNEYISREHRKEWSAVGMLGKLVVRDDGTCQVNEYCKVGKNGVATSSETGYRVLSRVDDTHIRVYLK